MSNSYPVYKDSNVEITLDESSGRFELDVTVHQSYMDDPPASNCTKKMSEDGIITLAVHILGPLFYFNPDGNIIEKLVTQLKQRGYT